MRKPKKRWIHCAECGRNKEHHAKGMCRTCCNRQYYEAHREERLAFQCQWNKDHRAERAAYMRDWRKANPDYDRRYHLAHREQKAESDRQWYAANRESKRAYTRQWFKDNSDKAREYVRRRRARKHSATIGPVDEGAVYGRDGYMCMYCGATRKPLTLDHIIPLAGGGSHCEDNLVAACRECNSRKNVKPLEVWLQAEPRSIAWVL